MHVTGRAYIILELENEIRHLILELRSYKTFSIQFETPLNER